MNAKIKVKVKVKVQVEAKVDVTKQKGKQRYKKEKKMCEKGNHCNFFTEQGLNCFQKVNVLVNKVKTVFTFLG